MYAANASYILIMLIFFSFLEGEIAEALIKKILETSLSWFSSYIHMRPV